MTYSLYIELRCSVKHKIVTLICKQLANHLLRFFFYNTAATHLGLFYFKMQTLIFRTYFKQVVLNEKHVEILLDVVQNKDTVTVVSLYD